MPFLSLTQTEFLTKETKVSKEIYKYIHQYVVHYKYKGSIWYSMNEKQVVVGEPESLPNIFFHVT